MDTYYDYEVEATYMPSDEDYKDYNQMKEPYGVVYESKKTGKLTIERYPNEAERDFAYRIMLRTHNNVTKIEPGETWVGEES